MATGLPGGQKSTPKDTQERVWGHPRVPWTFNLRLTEPYKAKLEFILANRREKSIHQMLAKILDAFIDTELERLEGAGISPDTPQD